MKTINLEQLDILFKNKPDNINVFLGQNWNSDLFLKVSNSKSKNKSKFFKFDKNEKNFNYVPYDIDEYSHLRKHNNLNSFIKEFLVLIKNNISDNNASIYNSNKNLEKYNLYKNVMLTGKYNEKLSQRYALQTFDKLVECDSCYIDKLEIIIYMDIKNNYYQYKENESFKKFTFKELKENYIKYIDKSILDYNRILDNQSRIKLDYDSILDTLRSVYSEFFI
jgi:hypothetical protein